MDWLVLSRYSWQKSRKHTGVSTPPHAVGAKYFGQLQHGRGVLCLRENGYLDSPDVHEHLSRVGGVAVVAVAPREADIGRVARRIMRGNGRRCDIATIRRGRTVPARRIGGVRVADDGHRDARAEPLEGRQTARRNLAFFLRVDDIFRRGAVVVPERTASNNFTHRLR